MKLCNSVILVQNIPSACYYVKQLQTDARIQKKDYKLKTVTWQKENNV